MAVASCKVRVYMADGVGVAWLAERLGGAFGGVTVWPAWGVFGGESERSVVLESVAFGGSVDAARAVVTPLAEDAARRAGERFVLVTVERVAAAELVAARVGPEGAREGTV